MSRSLCFNTSTEQICLRITPRTQAQNGAVLQTQAIPIIFPIPPTLEIEITPAERQLIFQLVAQQDQLQQQLQQPGINIAAINQQLAAVNDRYEAVISGIRERYDARF